MSENPSRTIRLLRNVARVLGVETRARALFHRWTQDNTRLFRLSESAGQHACYAQRLMDIDPASPWFQPGFAETFGGFHPPGETRALVRPFIDDRVRADFFLLLLRDITARRVPGALAELGVHRGRSARMLHHYCPERKLYLFDTFSGFAPEDFAQESLNLNYNQAQQFTDTSVELMLGAIEPRNRANIVPVVGWFPGSVTSQVEQEKFALVHLDADLEAPIAAGLDFFWQRLEPGGFIVLHDYNAWPGARLAAERFRTRTRAAAVPMPDKSGSIVFAKP